MWSFFFDWLCDWFDCFWLILIDMIVLDWLWLFLIDCVIDSIDWLFDFVVNWLIWLIVIYFILFYLTLWISFYSGHSLKNLYANVLQSCETLASRIISFICIEDSLDLIKLDEIPSKKRMAAFVSENLNWLRNQQHENGGKHSDFRFLFIFGMVKIICELICGPCWWHIW